MANFKLTKPKHIDVEAYIASQPKKRGPKPKDPYKNFDMNFINVFTANVIPNKQELIDIFSTEEPISKEDWNSLKGFVNDIVDLIDEPGLFETKFNDDIIKKTKSQIKTIDEIREQDTKRHILSFLKNEHEFYDDEYISYMVFLHLKNYIYYSSRACKY